MSYVARPIAAFALSVLVAGAVQRALVLLVLGKAEWDMLLWLAGVVVLVTAAMSVASRKAVLLGHVTVWLLVLLTLAAGVALVVAMREQSPGVGGNILFLVAVLVNVGFLIPAAAAILIHWWLLRGQAKTG
jgi:hypothetical protein